MDTKNMYNLDSNCPTIASWRCHE